MKSVTSGDTFHFNLNYVNGVDTFRCCFFYKAKGKS